MKKIILAFLIICGTIKSSAQVLEIYKDGTKVDSYTTDKFTEVRVRQEIKATAISISPTSIEVPAGSSTTLSTVFTPSNADNTSVTWSSSNTFVAKVNSNGVVTGVTEGNAIITCTAKDGRGLSGACNVTVTKCTAPNLLSGKFSVSSNKQVQFTRGNLFWDGSTYQLEASQTTYPTTWNAKHVGHFFWTTANDYKSGNATYMPYTETYAYSSQSTTDQFFCGADNPMTINDTDKLYALTNDEWNYLLNTRTNASSLKRNNVTVDGLAHCLILAPDDYDTSTALKSSYTLDELDAANLVCLAAAGERYNGTSITNAESSQGNYWSASPATDSYLTEQARQIYFSASYGCGTGQYYRYDAYPIRLVRAIIVNVSSITLDKTSLSMYVGDAWAQKLTASVLPEKATVKTYTWSSSNPSVATVSSSGLVTGLSVGTAVITCTADDGSGVKATCSVSVVKPVDKSGSIDGHAYVDLCLPSGTLWATCNVGTNIPYAYGNYYAWGETTPQSSFSWSNYTWCNGTSSSMTKYCGSSSYGTVDDKWTLEPADDAATVNWGSNWQMPSEDQFLELYNSDYTTATSVIMNGKSGIQIKSNTNGNTIFLPYAGAYWNGALNNAGTCGYYWSHSLHSSKMDNAYYLFISSSEVDKKKQPRYEGFCVRPVRSEIIEVSSITLNSTTEAIAAGGSATLTATILPEDASNKSYTWSSSDESVATVSSDGVVTGVSAGTATITCTAGDGSGVKATCTVTVTSGPDANGHEYVDLGLTSGTLWATMNVGATTAEGYGDYFAWGETTGYNSGKTTFDWSTYTLCCGSETTMTKYCTSSSYGTVDNQTELLPADDAAHVNWGGDWVMPSYDQQIELKTECTWTWTTQNGVYGRLITSKTNGNSIFLPAAGYRDDSSLNLAGSEVYYWSRTLYSSYPNGAYGLYFDLGSVYASGISRFYGQSVRPVLCAQN